LLHPTKAVPADNITISASSHSVGLPRSSL
jgi:hypothetical protein